MLSNGHRSYQVGLFHTLIEMLVKKLSCSCIPPCSFGNYLLFDARARPSIPNQTLVVLDFTCIHTCMHARIYYVYVRMYAYTMCICSEY
jgi:hypothetical protein